jgi:hypothetical protein
MESFIEKERIRLETKSKAREQRKTDKEARYRAWLEKPTRPLPSYERLAKWRRRLAYASLLSVSGCTIEVFFFYYTCFIGDYGFPIIFISLGWIFGMFALMFDYGIYRRWDGKKPYFFKWEGY